MFFRMFDRGSWTGPMHLGCHTSDVFLHKVTLPLLIKFISFHHWKVCLSPNYSQSNTACFYASFLFTSPTTMLFQTTHSLYPIVWSCRWVVLKAHFSSLVGLSFTVMSLKSLLMIMKSDPGKFLSPMFSDLSWPSQHCCLSSHPVLLNFFKNSETALSHIPTNWVNSLAQCPSWISVRISSLCSLFASFSCFDILWNLHQSRSSLQWQKLTSAKLNLL